MNKNYETLTGNILIVDDLAFNLQILMAILEPEGYVIKPVLNGNLALRSVNNSPPDLILLDINMPVMNGYEVCERLKSNPETRHIPVIFVSSFEEVQYRLKAYEVGGVDYVIKPILDVELLRRVENQIKIKTLEKEIISVRSELEHKCCSKPDY